MKAELELIIRETARLARDGGFDKTAAALRRVLAELQRESGAGHTPQGRQALH